MGYRVKIRAMAVAFIASLLCAQLNAQELWIVDARIIVGDGRVIEDGAIHVRDGRIVSVGQDRPETLSPETELINLPGRTIIPAMIDGHAHLGYQSLLSWHGDNYTRGNLIDNLRQYAYYGFAAVFSAGSDADDLAQEIQRDLAADRILDAARLLFAAGMAPPGQGPNNQFLVHTNAVAQRTGMNVLRGIGSYEEAVAAADDVAARGIEFIKIWVDDRNGSQQKLTPAVYRPLIQRASEHGIRVFVHQQYVSDMPGLLDAGVDGFLHGRLGDEFTAAIAQQTAQQGAFIIPNIGLGELRREAIAQDTFLRAILPGPTAERLGVNGQREITPRRDPDGERSLREAMGRLLDAGVEVVLGSDAGGVADHLFGYSAHRELEIYVRLGMSPEQALAAATRVAARRLGLDDLGTLEAGKSAAFVVLSENPLDDIRNTRSIERVYLLGREVNRRRLADAWRDRR